MYRLATWFTLALILAVLTQPVAQADTVKLTVKEVTGDVTIEASGREVRATVGMAFAAPAEVRTGANASMLLADAETTLKISPNSVIAIPASAQPSGMIDRILQRSGSVLYNVNSRKGRPFAVETALLTSVVKGTLFSINVQDQSAVVALLEGSLEVSGQNIGPPILLAPGDAARRRSGEQKISVDRHGAAASAPSNPRAVRSGSVPDALGMEHGMASATEDLAQITAAVGLAPPASTPSPSVTTLPPVTVPGTPPAASTTPPVVSPPVATPPDAAPPVSSPPATPPPVTAPPVSSPPATTPPLTTPPVAPPAATPPPVVSPPAATPPPEDDDSSGKGSRRGRGRGHDQGHGGGNDERDRDPP